MLHRLVLTAAASATAALSAVPTASAAPAGPVSAVPATASATGLATTMYGEPVLRSLPRMPPPGSVDDSGDRLTVTVHDAGGGADGTYELRCHPDGGSHPDVSGACQQLDRSTTWGKDPFAAVPPGTMCTMLYGGPATAHVTGTWAGRPVDAQFDRADGCEIARWDALVPLLPDSHV
ncbi:hypothetical protein GCM10011579_038590 [Streptomyces albiflavescens]|uniref:Subtilisin inhibitor domain-containing protein n=1 Tax=Streptomyces albiflavescens TaxID=1623582 RepID=A0A917Y6H3_9ACTN|nr:SSI family serine proteinase inhibitor [Streptomyces albiflavescens]GGN66800.1 hypothetical protein GCM10011579_038590 [Streptomyces albiflavescens]